MQIKLIGGNLLLKGAVTELLYDRQGKKVKNDYEGILVTSNKKTKNNKIVTSPGEYEIEDVLIYAMDIDDDSKLDAVAIDIDNVKVLFLPNQKNIDVESVLDSIGIVHVVVKDFNAEDVADQIAKVKEIEASVLIPLCPTDEVLQKVLKEFSAEGEKPQPTFRCKVKDFTADEVITSIALLK